MRISIIQCKQNQLYQFDKPELVFSFDQAKHYQYQMIEDQLTMLSKASRDGNDLLLTTEAFNFPGLPLMVEENYLDLIPEKNDLLFEKLAQIAKDGNCYVCAGVFYKECIKKKTKIYNAIFFFDRTGKLMKIYHKTHLAGQEQDFLTPGNKYVTVTTEFGKLGLAICFDMQFPETCQTLAQKGADLILAPTWGWEWIYGPGRAYENGVYVASAMAVPYQQPIEGLRSPSEIISPEGEILLRASNSQAQIISLEIDNIKDCKRFRDLRIQGKRTDLYK